MKNPARPQCPGNLPLTCWLFPEKRRFYLENSDLFANLGTDNLRPFFSHRIGLNSPVQAGARLSGKIGDNWRIRLMDLQSDTSFGPVIKADMLLDPHLALTDRDAQLLYQIEWINKSILQVDVKDAWIKLQSPFDPTNSADVPLPANEEFSWKEVGASFVSDLRKPFNFLVSSRYGGYFNGTRFTMNSELYFRVQPYGSLAIVATYNNISLPSPYNSAEFVLVRPRLDITFTNKLFFTSLVQYNNQIDNINLNFRFQWRFAPVSDLFIVDTENSFAGNYRVKNRGLVVKQSYWFN